ncbi:MAG: Ig-like domain repeat protein, partial [Gemmatimonadales bacterium]|nr:Ig-like domain repeat protein [Gemmatimonadales bacterium]
GNGQSGRVGEVLADSVVMEVLDGADRPVPGATVVIELSGAAAEPDTTSTDARGRAGASITLGSEIGEATGSARVIAPPSPAAVQARFAVMALAASANGLAGVSGDGQTGVAGETLADPLVVEVTDAFGNPIEGVPITWTPVGGGSVSESSTTSGADGRSSVTRTLGPTSGAQTTLATSEGLAGSPVQFSHTVVAGNASRVLVVAGNNQSAPPGAALPLELVVELVDPDGNPVVGAPITWVVTGGGGTLTPPTGITGADGRAATTWTLGPSVGTNTAQAIVSGVGQAEFTATAVAGNPSRIRLVSGNGQTAQAGTRLAAELVVQVLDANDNPVGSVPVSWSIVSGGGSVSPVSVPTGANGQASTAWTLGSTIGSQGATASVAGAGSVQFEATATAGAPSGLALVIQPSTVARIGVPFARQPVIQVRDASGNPVQAPGVMVIAAIAQGPGTLIGTTSRTTIADGSATFTDLAIEGALGPHTLIFSAGGFSSVTSSTIDVRPAQTTTSITADTPDPSDPGASVEVVFAVTYPGGVPPGTVVVTASGGPESCSAPVSAGRCSLALTVTGNRTLTASYQGSALFTGSSGTAPHFVQPPTPIGTSTRIISDTPDPSEPGANVEVVFEVTSASGTPPGNVVVTASGGSESCTASVATGRCSLALTAVGDRTLTATYQGSGLFTASSGTASHRVQAPSPIGTTTQITSDAPDPSAPGENVEVVFQVTSSSGPPPGTVVVTASGGSESCSASVATGRCTLALTVEGARTLTASYQGSGLFTASSDTEGHTVDAPDTPPTAVDDGFSATAGVELSVPAPGVLANDSDADGDPLSAQLLTGVANGVLALNADGSFTYTPNATFVGTDSFTYQVTAGAGIDSAMVTIVVSSP